MSDFGRLLHLVHHVYKMISRWCKYKWQITVFFCFRNILLIPNNMLFHLKSVILLKYFIYAEVILLWLVAQISHLKSVDGLDEFLLAPKPYADKVGVTELLTSLNEILLVNVVHVSLNICVLRLLELEHSASQDCHYGILEVLLYHR